ncbi:pseudouridine synthase [Virgibacillus halophilus]|uniref:RNA pseudouridylate synthase n=1 Tax=Tigheibacillus halophilus TaxID=361280 RepID=A0ABU5C9T1_9BACI|nr:pseudouridine synthase [Virgibacillus halophilus]
MLKIIRETDSAITVNGLQRNLWERLAAGDVLRVTFPEEKKAPYLAAENMELAIVYEDEAVLVIDKPAGVATIPSMNQPTGTIANGIRAYYEKKKLPYTVHIVTRLDRDTSGLMLIAKHRYSHAILSEMQKAKKSESAVFGNRDG